jgi:hypothetical protein
MWRLKSRRESCGFCGRARLRLYTKDGEAIVVDLIVYILCRYILQPSSVTFQCRVGARVASTCHCFGRRE